jgi:signal transduction histidine kinase
MKLPVAVAVLDRRGVIREVNDAWRTFVRENGALELVERSVGLNYLEVSRTATGPESDWGREVAVGIQAVLSGAAPSFSLVYHRRVATERRYFRIDVVPVAEAKRGALIAHTKLTAYKTTGPVAYPPLESALRTVEAVADKIHSISSRQAAMLRSLSGLQELPHMTMAEGHESHGDDGDFPPNFVGFLDEIADPVLLYGATGQAIHVNRACVELFGLDRDHGYFAVSVVERVQMLQMRDIATGRPFSTEELPGQRALRGETLAGMSAVDMRVRALHGREVDVSVSAGPVYAGWRVGGQIVGAIVVARDVTERRQMERERAAWASRLEVTLRTMQDGVTLTDREGSIVFSNVAFTTLFALDRDPTFCSRPLGERGARLAFSQPDGGQPLTADEMPVAQALHGKVLAGSHAMEIHARALDGRELDLSVSAVPLRDDEGRTVGAVTVYRDVTERREHDRERHRMMDLVAHELRHPLAILQMADELIRKDFARSDSIPRRATWPDKLSELLGFVDHGVTEMERLVEDMVDASQVESGHLTLQLAPTDLAELVRRQTEEEMLLHGTEIHVQAPKRRVMALVDRMRIAQVLTNLLTNAYKYSPANAAVWLRLRRSRGEARVEVTDEGPGISLEAQGRLFERFYRVPGMKAQQGAGGGLGLGLYLCFHLVQLHGGRIGVESTVGRGSTFWFTLPLVARAGTSIRTQGTETETQG